MPARTSQEQFDRQAEHYDKRWNSWSEASLSWLVNHSGCEPNHRVLDVATGTGFTALAFAPMAAHVTGSDVSEGMLAQAREQARSAGCNNIEFKAAPAESLPFPDTSFDIVTCRVAPHHFLSVPAFVAECYRVLAPGGRLLVADTTVPDGDADADKWQNEVEAIRDPSHVRNYSPAEWRGFVSAAGFELEEMAELQEQEPITLADWLKKSGCTGDPAGRVRQMFAQAPDSARRHFRIGNAANGDTTFYWMRVVLSAHKPLSSH